MRQLRFPDESDDAFRARAERIAVYANVLIDAALANHHIKQFIADPSLPYTEQSQRQSPTVRIEYEQAMAIGGIGECLHATRNKSWGDGPYIHPLAPDDPVDPMFILYVFKPNSHYHRRFEQRRRMKELLGRDYRKLVERAKYHRHTKKMFLESLTESEAYAIRRVFHVEPGEFWRAARGRTWLSLPPRQMQLAFPFEDA
ncbi:MAG: hypothetical protein H6822_20480 [Planctomycetaceae bacterium]|nr:hypothetical protein [Planctomycetales bacterium]MCB9924567.1 hypothetical protein [Planctomycetaceae bacterium]